MANYQNSLLPAILASRASGVPPAVSIRVGLIAAMAGNGQLVPTMLMSRFFAQRAKPAALPVDVVHPDKPHEKDRVDGEKAIEKIMKQLDVNTKAVRDVSVRMKKVDERLSALEASNKEPDPPKIQQKKPL